MDDAYLELGMSECVSIADNEEVLCSIAISLKRIADALEYPEAGGITNILDSMLNALITISSLAHSKEPK